MPRGYSEGESTSRAVAVERRSAAETGARRYADAPACLQRKVNPRALALRPDFPDACNNLGNALARKGDADAAIASYRQAIALGDKGLARGNLALALARSGPTTVLVLSLLFIAFVVLLHIWGKFRKG